MLFSDFKISDLDGFRADSWNVLSTSEVFLLILQLLDLLSMRSFFCLLHLLSSMMFHDCLSSTKLLILSIWLKTRVEKTQPKIMLHLMRTRAKKYFYTSYGVIDWFFFTQMTRQMFNQPISWYFNSSSQW